MPVAVQADKRFHRARTKPIRRRIWHRPWARVVRDVALAAVVLYVGYQGVTAATRTPLLSIRRIVVRGNEQLSTGEVDAILSGLDGRNLLGANLDAWRQRLLDSSWVRDATLRRALPSTVEVLITERKPIGIARMGERAVSDGRGGHDDRCLRAELRRVSTCRSSTGWRHGGRGQRGCVPGGGGGRSAGGGAEGAGPGAEACRRSTSATHDAVVMLDGDRRGCTWARREFRRPAGVVPGAGAGAAPQVANIDYVDLRFDDRGCT